MSSPGLDVLQNLVCQHSRDFGATSCFSDVIDSFNQPFAKGAWLLHHVG